MLTAGSEKKLSIVLDLLTAETFACVDYLLRGEVFLCSKFLNLRDVFIM